MPHLKVPEVVSVHCNIVNNEYQHDSRVLYTIIHWCIYTFGQLLDIFPKNLLFLKRIFIYWSKYLQIKILKQNK